MTNIFSEDTPKHIKILIVDDDDDDVFIIKTYLDEIEDCDYILEWARNYEEGLLKIQETQPDICLLDFLLGNKTGIQFLQEIRARGNDVPIILLTGKGDVKIDREAMSLGATDYLIKKELNSENIERSLRYALSHTVALRAMRTNAQLYQTIFDKSRNMIFLIDAQTLRFVEVNDMAKQILGYSKEHFLKELTLKDLFEDTEEANQMAQILMGGDGEITDYNVVLKTDCGLPRVCLLSAVKHQTPKGLPLFHGTISDITQLKQAEQDRLIAEKMAATSRFTRALAHEVRNPLTNIDLSIEQLESEYPEADWSDYLSIIKRNSKRIGTLITELLHTSNPINLEFSEQKLHSLLDKTLLMAQDRIHLKAVIIQKNYSLEDPSVWVASEAFKIAVLNIIMNAIEAVSDNTGIIHLSTHIQKNECFISIEDNGCGIPNDHLTQIFEPYVTTKTQGTGLGLITTLNVIKAHKGSIRVTSSPNSGTKFLITIPCDILKIPDIL